LGKQGAVTSVIDALLNDIPSDDSTMQRDQERLHRVKTDRDLAASKYFSENAASWNSLRALHVDQERVNQAIVGHAQHFQTHRLLDLGTGTGEMLRLFAPHIEVGEGIDLSRDMLAVARSKLEEENLDHCSVRQGDLYALPFPDNSFDTVIFHQVLHFVDDVAGALDEATRVLMDGGQMLIADFAPHDIEYLRTTHQHRRLGFGDNDFDETFKVSDLNLLAVEHLQGAPLTVTVWHARKGDAISVSEAVA
jgi:ubiquinone/menaquinone biosynthesis C-methylase UbiE